MHCRSRNMKITFQSSDFSHTILHKLMAELLYPFAFCFSKPFMDVAFLPNYGCSHLFERIIIIIIIITSLWALNFQIQTSLEGFQALSRKKWSILTCILRTAENHPFEAETQVYRPVCISYTYVPMGCYTNSDGGGGSLHHCSVHLSGCNFLLTLIDRWNPVTC